MLSAEANSFLRQVFRKAFQSVKPEELISSQLKILENKLVVNEEKYSLDNGCYVVGFGKAVLHMGCEVQSILKNHLRKAVLSVPEGSMKSGNNTLLHNTDINVFGGAKNNMPDKNSYFATSRILELVDGLTENDLLLVLISGGGSALLVSPVEGVSLEEKAEVTRLLAHAGADITELNAVRVRLSQVKGGKLAARAYPAKVLALILSDVIGDPLHVIASGPITPAPHHQNPMAILEKYNLVDRVSSKIINVITKSEPEISYEVFKNTRSLIIGNNLRALSAAKSFIESSNASSCILTSTIKGQVEIVANAMAYFVILSCQFILKKNSVEEFKALVKAYSEVLFISEENLNECISLLSKKEDEIFLLLGGETTVLVKGDGKGGRNMEIALRFSYELSRLIENFEEINDFELGMMSAGTDGIDGPTDAAGAIGYPEQVKLAHEQGLDVLHYINNNDSYNFFKSFNAGQDLVITGHTGTNVMDIMILYIKRKH